MVVLPPLVLDDCRLVEDDVEPIPRDVIVRGMDKQLEEGIESKSKNHPGVAIGALMSSYGQDMP